MIMTLSFTHETSRGVEHVHKLPAVYEVCERCEGYGTHLTPSIGQHAYTAEEFHESFDDEEAEEYCRRGGRYDVTCETCSGIRVALVPDVATCERTSRGRRLLALYYALLDREARYRAVEAYERRMGY